MNCTAVTYGIIPLVTVMHYFGFSCSANKIFSFLGCYTALETSLVVKWSGSLTTNHEVTGSIPGFTMGIFLEGEDSRGDHGLGRLVEFRFKAPPVTTPSSITTHTSSGKSNCASWASQTQKSVTLLPYPGGRTTKSTKDMRWHWTKKINKKNKKVKV